MHIGKTNMYVLLTYCNLLCDFLIQIFLRHENYQHVE